MPVNSTQAYLGNVSAGDARLTSRVRSNSRRGKDALLEADRQDKVKHEVNVGEQAMKEITMLELRLSAEKIIAQVQKGQRMLLTRRGKPVARLEPIEQGPAADDPFYSIAEDAVPGESLSNEEIDRILYGR